MAQSATRDANPGTMTRFIVYLSPLPVQVVCTCTQITLTILHKTLVVIRAELSPLEVSPGTFMSVHGQDRKNALC